MPSFPVLPPEHCRAAALEPTPKEIIRAHHTTNLARCPATGPRPQPEQHRNHSERHKSHCERQRNHSERQRSYPKRQRSHSERHKSHLKRHKSHSERHRNHPEQHRNHSERHRSYYEQQRNHPKRQRNHSERQSSHPIKRSRRYCRQNHQRGLRRNPQRKQTQQSGRHIPCPGKQAPSPVLPASLLQVVHSDSMPFHAKRLTIMASLAAGDVGLYKFSANGYRHGSRPISKLIRARSQPSVPCEKYGRAMQRRIPVPILANKIF